MSPQSIGQLIAITSCFTLEQIERLRPEFGQRLRAVYEKDDEDDFIDLPTFLQDIADTCEQLIEISRDYTRDIAWLHDQLVRIAAEAESSGR